MKTKSEIKAHKGTFIKQNGEKRTMTFVTVPDLPQEFLSAKIKGSGKQRMLTNGLELVWEVETGFRVFNWNKIVGEIQEVFVGKDVFLLDK